MRWLRKLLGLEPRTPEREAESEATRPIGWSSMAALLEELGHIADEHDELFDTDVRERIHEAADRRVVKAEPGYQVPTELGMFSPEGNERVRAALEVHLQRIAEVFDAFGLETEAERRRSFFNPKVRSDEGGYHVDDFFGHP